jgi:hypothetical protein
MITHEVFPFPGIGCQIASLKIFADSYQIKSYSCVEIYIVVTST